ncbi:MAG: hypothetical protein IJ619_09115 [Eubacterium sp.]|nr:hypothetical protein [Eubacterium sp.]
MTVAQRDICNYLDTQFRGCQYELIGEGSVKVTDRGGKSMTFTCNLFGDIMDAETKEIVATSDLPHDLDKIGFQRPTKWENSIGYFG